MRAPAVGTLRREAAPWGIPASIALHALLAAVLVLMPLPKPPKRLEEERVSVDILTPRQFEAATRPTPAQAMEAPPQVPKPQPALNRLLRNLPPSPP
ncbi:hypothetical protein [Mesorhizobium sp. B2-7-1]|uniref:hypothetical protein n=1 Tax=Mesorhizobium sp. B2-7-1 TaxID=2589909 RepID=UPI00112E878F|nr:hypothetical protein [Mesorhizobium sp. B2-7-1]TPJ69729.1 hypothetical protein FJ471_10055 [Mesorhizobium sp. B2-7-1]